MGPPLCVVFFGKNLICSVVIWQKLREAKARIWFMWSRFTNRFLPSLFEMRTNSTGHLASDRGDVSPSDCLRARPNRMNSGGNLDERVHVAVATFRCSVPEGILSYREYHHHQEGGRCVG